MAAFTKALYYPFIDIQNSDWLKTAVLFWDEILTIVPKSIEHPYNQYDSEYLADKGILKPFHVDSNERSVIDIEEDVLNLMFTPEIMGTLMNSPQHRYNGIYNEKMSYKLREELTRMMGRNGIYAEKMSSNIKHQLRHFNRSLYRDGIYYLEDSWTHLYMTILANKICENESVALVTDNAMSHKLSNSVKLDNQVSFVDRYRNERNRLSQGLLLDLVVKNLRICPETPLPNIVEFREQHKEELASFRTLIADLTQGITIDKPINVLRQEIEDLYLTKFSDGFRKLESALESSKIKWIASSILITGLFSMGANNIPMEILGLSTPHALVAGATLSAVVSAVVYNTDKERILKENPYSYLLALEKDFR